MNLSFSLKSLNLIDNKDLGRVVFMKKKLLLAITTFSLISSVHAQSLCVFDLSGAGGDIYSNMQDYAVAARNWDVDFKLKPYTDETLVIKDFKAGKCDAVSVEGIRAREFNSFTGSIDAVGALTDIASLKIALALMANPKLAPEMINGAYEVVGVATVGTLYLMVKDRTTNSIQKMTGKKFGILDYDKADNIIVDKIGGIPVTMNLANLGSKFNIGEVDIAPMVPLMFRPFELNKGLGTQGAILRFPILQLTGDIIIRHDKFPLGFGQKSRTWMGTRIDREVTSSQKVEAGIPANYWADIAESDKKVLTKILRECRISLTNQKALDKKMMGILKRVRCRVNPTNYDCKLNEE
jgi:hypothetical protein